LLTAGRYNLIERVAMALVICFTAITVMGAVVLLKLPEYFSWPDLAEGLSFQPPQGGLLTAVAAFGITGVGATELVMYPYWCIEKGYARYTGEREESIEWASRARGWTRVMGIDVANSAVIYTFATVAFYLLGAGVLHGMGVVPAGSQMVQALSNVYTETLGAWSQPLFLAGAFAVLYSTVFSSTAAHSRVFADFAGMLGLYDRSRYELRLRAIRVFTVILLLAPISYLMWLREPVLMVKIGGVAQASMLPLISCYTIYLRHKRMPRGIVPGPWVTLALWVSALLIAAVMGYSAVQRLIS
jgi:Mn2+/Fe2+ NRAMP family transporter